MKGFEHMKKKKYSSFEVRRRISRCKKRLRNLKIQGFTFSDDIYDDIEKVEKMKQKTGKRLVYAEQTEDEFAIPSIQLKFKFA